MFSITRIIHEIRLNSKEILKQHLSSLIKIIEDLFSEKAISKKGLIAIILKIVTIDYGFSNYLNWFIRFPVYLSLV